MERRLTEGRTLQREGGWNYNELVAAVKNGKDVWLPRNRQSPDARGMTVVDLYSLGDRLGFYEGDPANGYSVYSFQSEEDEEALVQVTTEPVESEYDAKCTLISFLNGDPSLTDN